jgi:hypothetical protein
MTENKDKDNDNEPDKIQVYKGIKDMLVVNYKFTNKSISGSALGSRVKKYYEKNSRDLLSINVSSFTVNIPFNHTPSKVSKALSIAKGQIAKEFGRRHFDMYLHFCDPKISHTGAPNAITFRSFTNAVHESGHLLKFGHANTRKYIGVHNKPMTLHCRDPFDCMTIFAPYPSLNPVHRYSHGWYLDGEIQDCVIGSHYKMAMLKDLDNKKDLKVLKYVVPTTGQNYFISYGTWQNNPKMVFHTSNPTFAETYLDGFFGLNKGIVSHPRVDFNIKIISFDNATVSVDIVSKDSTVPDNENEADALEFYDEPEQEECNDCAEFLQEEVEEINDNDANDDNDNDIT